jgi:hypothetical protein
MYYTVAGDMGWKPPYVKQWTNIFRHWFRCTKMENIVIPWIIVKKCTDKRCMTCPSLIEGISFTFKNGRTFTVMQDISCKAKNLVYAIICSNCGEFYVITNKINEHL